WATTTRHEEGSPMQMRWMYKVLRLLGIAGLAEITLQGSTAGQARNLMSQPNDPLIAKQWALTSINAPAAWDITTGSGSIVIAVLDSGVDVTHPDLAGKLVPGRNVVDDSADVTDSFGHGTHVAGIAAAAGNNGVGIAGVSWGAR